jgi:hypothetical protein
VIVRILGIWLTGILAWGLLSIPGSVASAAPDSYVPPAGVRFNDPYGRVHAKNEIRQHIIRTINSTEPGAKIRISAWNIRGLAYRNAIIAAHQRGVSVGIVMDLYNANADHPNPEMDDIEAAFNTTGQPWSNELRTPDMQSFVKKCASSCRSTGGIPHTKLFLFDMAAGMPWISMYGSINATDVAVNDQWNDLFTLTNNQPVYDALLAVFNEMVNDTAVAQPYRRLDFPGISFDVYPYAGAVPWADPDLAKLNAVRCMGATGGAGRRGHTVVRMAQDALLGNRGQAIANRLATMKRRGCNIKIVYSLMGRPIRRTLVNAGVPLRQYSYDRDRDGYYDIYLHMKSMSISGVYNGQTNARIVFNGTANWTPVALASDELVGTIPGAGVEWTYRSWINYLFDHRPSSWGSVNLAPISYDIEGRVARYDPWAKAKAEGL